MCLTQPGTVIDLDAETLLVDVYGRRQRVANLLVPDARAGDEVLIGMGQALAVLTPAEAAELRELIVTVNKAANPA
jgi:hydrogenase expression/formation protein HypC